MERETQCSLCWLESQGLFSVIYDGPSLSLINTDIIRIREREKDGEGGLIDRGEWGLKRKMETNWFRKNEERPKKMAMKNWQEEMWVLQIISTPSLKAFWERPSGELSQLAQEWFGGCYICWMFLHWNRLKTILAFGTKLQHIIISRKHIHCWCFFLLYSLI